MPKSDASPQRLLRAVGAGCLLAAGVSLAMCMLLAVLLAGETLPEGVLQPAALPVALLSALAGGMLSAETAGGRRLPAALGTGALYVLLMFLLRALWFEGAWAPWPAAAALTGSLAAGMLASRRKKRRKA